MVNDFCFSELQILKTGRVKLIEEETESFAKDTWNYFFGRKDFSKGGDTISFSTQL
jgi:hypothetical protein